MPAMKSNQPMKNDYVSGLEDRLAKKVKKAGRAFSQAADTGMGMATKGAKEVIKRFPMNPIGRSMTDVISKKYGK